jgi:hypothetical protein
MSQRKVSNLVAAVGTAKMVSVITGAVATGAILPWAAFYGTAHLIGWLVDRHDRKANDGLSADEVRQRLQEKALEASHERVLQLKTEGKCSPRPPARRLASTNRRREHRDREEINAMFERLYARKELTPSSRQFIDSVHKWWEQKGFLTKKQYDAIKRQAYRK